MLGLGGTSRTTISFVALRRTVTSQLHHIPGRSRTRAADRRLRGAGHAGPDRRRSGGSSFGGARRRASIRSLASRRLLTQSSAGSPRRGGARSAATGPGVARCRRWTGRRRRPEDLELSIGHPGRSRPAGLRPAREPPETERPQPPPRRREGGLGAELVEEGERLSVGSAVPDSASSSARSQGLPASAASGRVQSPPDSRSSRIGTLRERHDLASRADAGSARARLAGPRSRAGPAARSGTSRSAPTDRAGRSATRAR